MAEPELQPDPLCVRFVNTVDWRDDPNRRKDPLKSYSDLLRWARNDGVISAGVAHKLMHESGRHPAVAQTCFLHAITVREALAALLTAAVERRPPPPEDMKRFNAALGEAGEHLRLEGSHGQFRLDWDSDRSFERVLWPVVRSAAELLTSRDLQRLRICEGKGCGWFFLDTTRNRSRRWCNMAVCGNRAKVKRFYERHKE